MRRNALPSQHGRQQIVFERIRVEIDARKALGQFALGVIEQGRRRGQRMSVPPEQNPNSVIFAGRIFFAENAGDLVRIQTGVAQALGFGENRVTKGNCARHRGLLHNRLLSIIPLCA
jgi:hypothetical protein